MKTKFILNDSEDNIPKNNVKFIHPCSWNILYNKNILCMYVFYKGKGINCICKSFVAKGINSVCKSSKNNITQKVHKLKIIDVLLFSEWYYQIDIILILSLFYQEEWGYLSLSSKMNWCFHVWVKRNKVSRELLCRDKAPGIHEELLSAGDNLFLENKRLKIEWFPQ